MANKFNIRIMPSGIDINASEDLTILQAAINSDIHLEHSCRDGSCGTCKAKLLHGNVIQANQLSGISDEERQEGYILTCSAKPTTNLELKASYYPQLKGIKPAIYPCKVESLDFPVSNIAILKLKLPPNSNFRFLAGQYVDLIMKGERRSYSIANSIYTYSGIELHIRKVNDGLFSGVIFNELKLNQLLRFEGPLGTFFVRDSNRPIIFLAGGSGFAPVKAMVETLLSEDSKRKMYIYWGMEKSDDFYSSVPSKLEKENNNVKFTMVVSGADETWKGRKGFVHKSVLEDFENLSSFDVYACGSPNMIEAARIDFIKKGLLAVNFFTDAFLPAI